MGLFSLVFTQLFSKSTQKNLDKNARKQFHVNSHWCHGQFWSFKVSQVSWDKWSYFRSNPAYDCISPTCMVHRAVKESTNLFSLAGNIFVLFFTTKGIIVADARSLSMDRVWKIPDSRLIVASCLYIGNAHSYMELCFIPKIKVSK